MQKFWRLYYRDVRSNYNRDACYKPRLEKRILYCRHTWFGFGCNWVFIYKGNNNDKRKGTKNSYWRFTKIPEFMGNDLTQLLYDDMAVCANDIPAEILVSIKHFTEQDMGKTMSVFGLGTIIWRVVVPALSDKFGRKPIVVIFFLLSMLMPLGVVYWGQGFASLSMFVLLGTSIAGCFPDVLATIPSETIPHQYIAQTLGLVMEIGELVGGFAAPSIAGWWADRFGLQAPFLIAAGAALSAGMVAFFLYETAPSLLNKKHYTKPVAIQESK